MKKILSFLPSLLYYGSIFALSSRSSFPIQEPFVGFDKVVHIAEFAGLGFLLALGFFRSFNFRSILNVALTFLSGTALGFMDEFHQFFVPGRNSDLRDAGADVLGIALGIFVFWRMEQRTKGKCRPMSND